MTTTTKTLIGLGAVLLSATAALAEARTLRIETRPYTSAVVTVENGVRVWRPLPPADRVIINPGNRATINLDVDAGSRYRGDNYNYNYNQNFNHGSRR